MPVVTVESNPKFQEVFVALQDTLTTFAGRPTEEITTVLVSSFGENFDVRALLSLSAQLQTGQVTSFPAVESVPASELNGAVAAYDASTNTTYISEDYLETSSTEELSTTLLEQLGYSVDEVINAVDAPGDEGKIWATLVQGESLSTQALAALKAADNNQTLTINNQTIAVEVSSFPNSSSPDNGSSGGGGSNGETNPFQGGKGRDRFKGDASDNIMSGGAGRDRLVGAGGNDTMDGGGGKDVINGGDGDDTMVGGGGSDRMNGGKGDDLMTGGKGKDKMKGGKGADRFIYEKMGDRGDIISDFATADVLDFSELFTDLGIQESRFNQLIDDVIILGSTRKGTQISIDADGLDGNGKAKKLLFLKKVDASDLKRRNFEL